MVKISFNQALSMIVHKVIIQIVCLRTIFTHNYTALEGSPESASLGQKVGGVGGGASNGNTGRGRKRPAANDGIEFG